MMTRDKCDLLIKGLREEDSQKHNYLILQSTSDTKMMKLFFSWHTMAAIFHLIKQNLCTNLRMA